MATYGPQPARPRDRDGDVAMAEFDSTPLFMRNLPPEESDNVAYEAIKSLVYEGTPNEQALNLKIQGNDYFKAKRFREALGFYNQGLSVNPDDIIVKEALLMNRAACNIELGNYGIALRDTSAALTLNPSSVKGYYRSSVALAALGKYTEALDACDRGLLYHPTNSGLREQQEKMAKLKGDWDAKLADKADKERKEAQEKAVKHAAFRALGLIQISTGKPKPLHTQYEPHFDPNFSGFRTSATPVLFPVFLLYPQYNTSDLITSFDPSATFAWHLSTMFPPTPGHPVSPGMTAPNHSGPPDWDRAGEYTAQNLAVYATTNRRRMLKIGKRMTLRDACDAAARVAPGEERDGLELCDDAITFTVVPKGERERAWVEEYKRKQSMGA